MLARDGAGPEGMMQVADLGALFQGIDDRETLGIEAWVDLRLVVVVGAGCGNEGAGPHQLGRQVGPAGRGAGDDDVAFAHRGEVGRRPHVERQGRRHFAGEQPDSIGIEVPDMHALEFGCRRDRPELDAALHAGAADRRYGRAGAREMAGGQGGGRAGAVDGDLYRIHHRQRSSVGAVGQVDDALHGRQAVGRRIAREVAVDLDGNLGVSAEQCGAFGVERSAGNVQRRSGRGHGLARFGGAERRFDRVDIVAVVHQARDVGAREDQKFGHVA
jgi:hypothetical protein